MDDEWDDFLNKRSASSADLDEPVSETAVVHEAEKREVDVGQYVDNAEVFIQLSRGESLTQLSQGIFINSTTPTSAQRQQLALSAKPSKSSSNLPVANSLSDLAKLLPGHPRLSHPLAQLNATDRESIRALLASTCELESLMLFFYAAVKDLKIESESQVAYSEIAQLKRDLIGQVLLEDGPRAASSVLGGIIDDSKMTVSLENLRLLCGAIPPNGKSPFLIPFRVSETGQVDLTSSALVSDFASGSTVESLSRFYRLQLEQSFPSTPLVTSVLFGESLKVAIVGKRPLFNVNLAFRGASHADPLHALIHSLFYKQPNYNVSVEAETGRVSDLKIYVPRQDLQAKLFNLLALLAEKLSQLSADKQYFLLHLAGTPNIKILEFNSAGNGAFDVNLFKF